MYALIKNQHFRPQMERKSSIVSAGEIFVASIYVPRSIRMLRMIRNADWPSNDHGSLFVCVLRHRKDTLNNWWVRPCRGHRRAKCLQIL